MFAAYFCTFASQFPFLMKTNNFYDCRKKICEWIEETLRDHCTVCMNENWLMIQILFQVTIDGSWYWCDSVAFFYANKKYKNHIF